MADEKSDEKSDIEGGQDSLCMPCDGRGKVISNLGGEATEVPCPWCEGTGRRLQGIDAQARWLAQREQDGADEPSGVQPSTRD